ncbi:PREDICTED: ankyrin repeat and MYND domain-containing protein 2 [Nicrophorus vespilloides]|uniref:Ankyrin repeat and MYND domain-containing protein 2 n=1 Tax=Nicrophorus vespilloides TaxID=110193 RepID=A0ABM1M2G8_NICVS|nr:PREDICTED: ankyrin repeat and MYND domain-containing protein 2 [Nicrophorus vespilloides]
MEKSMKTMTLEDSSNGPELTEPQAKIMKAIEDNNFPDFQQVLEENPKLDVNFLNQDKMTPLQQASYRCNADFVRLLIQRGADVNKCEHEHEYSALHFAALSGNIELVHVLLANGVKVNATNSINRTAAQMAAFVGYHHIVTTINNFIPKSDVDYYTVIHGQESAPHLDPELAENFYNFSLLYNLHPVNIAMSLQSYEGLLENVDEVRKVFQMMSEREMKRKESNEVLSFKFFYISYILGEISKLIKARKESNASEEKNFIELFSKKLLKCNKEGNMEYMEAFLKESIREFPYIDSTLFRQMVASLATDGAPSALSVITAAINGQRAFMDGCKCETCGEERPAKKCAKCKTVSYCDRECQRLHWFMHKKTCARMGAETITKNVDSREISSDLQGLLQGN